MENKGGELFDEYFFIEFFRTAQLLLQLLDCLVIKVVNEKFITVSLQNIIVALWILYYIFNRIFCCYSFIWVPVHVSQLEFLGIRNQKMLINKYRKKNSTNVF